MNNLCSMKKKKTMTEIEYIKATNRVKVSMSLTILRDVLPGEDYMVGKEEFREILSRLQAIEERLFASYECDNL